MKQDDPAPDPPANRDYLRLDECTLSIARCLGYSGSYEGVRDDAGFFRAIDFLTNNFSDEARTLIFDVIVICSEQGPLSDADLAGLKAQIVEIENGRA